MQVRKNFQSFSGYCKERKAIGCPRSCGKAETTFVEQAG